MKIKQTLCTTSKIWKKNAVVSGNSRDWFTFYFWQASKPAGYRAWLWSMLKLHRGLLLSLESEEEILGANRKAEKRPTLRSIWSQPQTLPARRCMNPDIIQERERERMRKKHHVLKRADPKAWTFQPYTSNHIMSCDGALSSLPSLHPGSVNLVIDYFLYSAELHSRLKTSIFYV
jgi:hypothetical protein